MKNAGKLGIAIGLFVALSALGLMVWQGAQGSAGTAYAQGGPTATPVPGSGQNQPNGAGQMMSAFWNALAARLGIGVDDLKSKAVAAQKDVIEQQVKDGTLTRAQADRMEQQLDANGVPFFGGPHGGPGGFGRGGFFGVFGGSNTLDAAAKALNLTRAELDAQLQSGKTLADVAKAQKVDETVVKQAIIDAAKADIQSKVQSGAITQAQADQMLSRLTVDRIDLSRPLGHHAGPFGGSQ